MALQLILTALSPDAAFIASCAKFFHGVEHHPSNDKNPYEIYVLETAQGSQIEALPQSHSLHLDVSTSILADQSLQEAIFEVAKAVPCAIWSDDAPVALVTDPGHLEAAANTLELSIDDIEPVEAASDLFEVLFGYEAPRAVSPDLAPGLSGRGFKIDETDHHRATLTLPNGIFLELDPDENLGWHQTEGVALGVADPRFAVVMQGWTPDITGPLRELGARKRRQDTAGYVLWSGHLRFGQFPATVETPVLGIYEQPVPLCTLVEQLSDVTNPKELARNIFGGLLNTFVMPTEGLWVFLFLMAEAGCDCAETYEMYNRLKSDGATFHTSNDLTKDAIDAYWELHSAQLGERG